MSALHRLKTLPMYYSQQLTGEKRFEIRFDDRDFRVNDYLLLAEFFDGKFSGRELLVQITCMCTFEQKEGFVVLGTEIIKVVCR
jgi:hypothetical protein